MNLDAAARKAGLDESEIRALRLLAKALGLQILYVEIVPPGRQSETQRKKVFNYDE